MANKPITLKNRVFKSQTSAKDYFSDKKEELKVKENGIESGELFDKLLDIYTLYCQYSGDEYTDLYKKVTKFTVEKNLTNYIANEYATTTCYFTVDKDGNERDYSINEAIKCVSRRQNSRNVELPV